MLTHFLLDLDPDEDVPAVACGAQAFAVRVLVSSSIEAETTCPDCLVILAH